MHEPARIVVSPPRAEVINDPTIDDALDSLEHMTNEMNTIFKTLVTSANNVNVHMETLRHVVSDLSAVGYRPRRVYRK
jgi:hypothetical protein